LASTLAQGSEDEKVLPELWGKTLRCQDFFSVEPDSARFDAAPGERRREYQRGVDSRLDRATSNGKMSLSELQAKKARRPTAKHPPIYSAQSARSKPNSRAFEMV
jgi:hypothetical protein